MNMKWIKILRREGEGCEVTTNICLIAELTQIFQIAELRRYNTILPSCVNG